PGGTATRLSRGIAHEMQPRFGPDGRTLVFVSDRSGDENVWLIDAAGGEPYQLTTGKDATYLSPEWTPDGNYIVVPKAMAIGGNEKLWLYHVKGGRGLEMVGGPPALRSEEHTSELQSREKLVCRLLLEKKNYNHN